MTTNLIFNTKSYIISESIATNISDSFVDRSVKTGNGAGETRLYVSQQRSSSTSFFTFDRSRTVLVQSGNRKKNYNPCPFKGVFLKSNLLNYLYDSETDYLFPAYTFNNPDFPYLYQRNLNLVDSLPTEMPFTIHDQNGKEDPFRFYIGSGDSIWHTVRSLTLPFTSEFLIHKAHCSTNPQDIIYFFEVRKKSLSPTANTTTEQKITKTIETITSEIKNDTTIDSTEKETLIIARKGQGKFRNNVLELMPSCPFTGINHSTLLRASHIMPWKDCSTNHERLDGYNGLALTPTYDTLFDLGLISFLNTGALLISPRLPKEVQTALNLISNRVYNIHNTTGERNKYLDFHSSHVFREF